MCLLAYIFKCISLYLSECLSIDGLEREIVHLACCSVVELLLDHVFLFLKTFTQTGRLFTLK